MNIVIAIIMALFISNSTTYTYQPFDPDWLNDTRIELVTPCSGFACLFMTKDGSKYLVVVDRRNKTRFVYRFVGDMNKPTLDLLWAKEMI